MRDVFDEVQVKSASRSLQGPREINEDVVAVCPEHGLLIIADGMGGGDRGDLAAKTACEVAMQSWSSGLENNMRGRELIDHVLRCANRRIYDLAHELHQDLGTTLTVAAFDGPDRILIGQAGDSGVYRFRDGKVSCLTVDHRAGSSNVLRVNIGGQEILEPHLADADHRRGDVLLLTTDGLSELTNEKQLEGLYLEAPPDRLADRLMANRDNQASDNYSCITCWDELAVVQWWQNEAERRRDELRAHPTAAAFASVIEALRQSKLPLDRVQELAASWSHANDAAVLSVAAEALDSGERNQLLEQLCDSSSAALLELGEIVATGDAPHCDGDRSEEVVRRAYAIKPTPPMALYLLKRTKEADVQFSQLLGGILREDPGPWYHAWTILCKLAYQPDSVRICQQVLEQLSEGSQVPLVARLAGKSGQHPIETIIEKLREEWSASTVQANKTLVMGLKEQEQGLAQLCDHLRGVHSQLEQQIAQMRSELIEMQRAGEARHRELEQSYRETFPSVQRDINELHQELSVRFRDFQRSLDRMTTETKETSPNDAPEGFTTPLRSTASSGGRPRAVVNSALSGSASPNVGKLTRTFLGRVLRKKRFPADAKGRRSWVREVLSWLAAAIIVVVAALVLLVIFYFLSFFPDFFQRLVS